jgi:phospholipase C
MPFTSIASACAFLRFSSLPGPKGTVINDVFEHASIPATVTQWFIPNFDATNARSPREIVSNTFLDHLSLDTIRDNSDCPDFQLS